MQIQITYNNKSLNKVFEILREAKIKVNETEKYKGIVYINNTMDIDIVIAYLSRYIFTNTFYQFECNVNLSSSSASILRKNYRGLIFVREALLKYLRNGNTRIDLEKFISYNITDIQEVYEEMLKQVKIDMISNQIADFLYPQENVEYYRAKANLLYAFNEDNFYLSITDMYGEELIAVTPDNINNFARASFFRTIRELEFIGHYNLKVINMIYKKCIEQEHSNIKFNLSRMTMIQKGK